MSEEKKICIWKKERKEELKEEEEECRKRKEFWLYPILCSSWEGFDKIVQNKDFFSRRQMYSFYRQTSTDYIHSGPKQLFSISGLPIHQRCTQNLFLLHPAKAASACAQNGFGEEGRAPISQPHPEWMERESPILLLFFSQLDSTKCWLRTILSHR